MSHRRSLLFKNSSETSGFLGLDLTFHIRAWEGINVDGSGDFVSLTDLTGNGYDFTPETGGSPTLPIEIVSSAIGGKQGLRFDGTNNIYCDVNFDTAETEIFHFCVFKIEGNHTGTYGVISGAFNTSTSLGVPYMFRYNGAAIYNDNNGVLTSTVSRLGDHYAFQNSVYGHPTDGNVVDFSVDNETLLSGTPTSAYNQNYWCIGAWRVPSSIRGSRILFCEAGCLIGGYDQIDSSFLTAFHAYMTATYGL